MSVVSTVVKGTADVARKGVGVVESLVRKAWSVLDAASEKKVPSENLSKGAIRAIQGNPES